MFRDKNKIYDKQYEGIVKPFKIIGNVYFVGCYGASSHLIDTGDGLILIDTGYADTLHLLINSIYELGFSPYDVKYIIHTHWHGDHTEATRPLVALTGSKTCIGVKDAPKVRQYFEPDVLLKDGDIVELGNTKIEIMETPGHTEGCISVFFDTVDNDKTYKVGMFGGAGSNTLVPEQFDYPDCRNGYYNSIEKLMNRKVDVFIGNHVWNNNTQENGELLRTTGENRFINSGIWYEFLNFCKTRLDKIIEQENNN